MNQNKYCHLIFKEKEALPLEREFMNDENKSTYSLPLTDAYSSICLHMSSSQKQILAREVNKAKKIQEMSNQLQMQLVNQSANLEGTQQFLEQTMKIKQNKRPSDYIPQRVFGSDLLVDLQSDFNFAHSFGLNSIYQREVTPKSTIAILLYSGEFYFNLNNSANYFQDMNIYTIILINGKTDFLRLMQSHPDLFEKIYKEEYLQFENFYSTSSSHAMIFEQQEEKRSYIVFPRQLQYIQLVKWIYLGIGKYIDPQFLIVTSSNQQFKINGTDFKKILTFCGDIKNKTFGVQWIEKTNTNSKLQGLGQLINFIDYGATPISVDGIFAIKQFHNPLSCIYNWEFIASHVTNYFAELYEKQLVNDIGLSLNSILPVLMYNTEKMQLCQLAESISEQNIGHLQQFDVFQKIGHKNYSIQQQLKEGVAISNASATVGFKFKLLIQYLISVLFYFEKYFSFSICIIQIYLGLFFAFQCPYQLLYYLLDHQKGYTALSVILPILYILNVLMFLIISFLYKMEDKIVLKQLPQEKVVLSLQFNKAQMNSRFSVDQKYKCYGVYDQRDNELRVDVVNDNLIQKYSAKIKQNKEKFMYYKIDMMIPQYLTIMEVYSLLKTNQNILDFIVAFATIVNLVVIYGQNFIWDVTIYELIVIIFAIVAIAILTIRSCIRGKSCNPLSLLLMLINFSTINFISTFYSQTLKIATPEIQIRKKKQLALQLFFNFIALYMYQQIYISYIAIESYYNYAGYVLLAITGYLVFMQLFPVLILTIKCACDPNYKKLNETVIENVREQQDQNLTLDRSIDQTIQDSRTLIRNVEEADKIYVTNRLAQQSNNDLRKGRNDLLQQSSAQQQKANQEVAKSLRSLNAQQEEQQNKQSIGATQNQTGSIPQNVPAEKKNYHYSQVTNQSINQTPQQFQESNHQIQRAVKSQMQNQIPNEQFNVQPSLSAQAQPYTPPQPTQLQNNMLQSSKFQNKQSVEK